jgi:glycosyltransferase involved in cell wall biosynthesis
MATSEIPSAGSSRPDSLRVQAVLLNSLGPGSIAHALTELLDNFPTGTVDRKLWCLATDPNSPHEYDRPALPRIAYRALCKARVPIAIQAGVASRVARRSIIAGDIVYLWPPYDLELIKRAQDKGAVVVAERTNCMGAFGRERLLRAFGRRELPLPEGWFPAEGIAEEREQMLQCDYVTAANALVYQSLRDADVPEDRILETSYGFNPKRLARAIDLVRPTRRPIFAFVGSGDVRKGLDVLLEAWERADIKGTLLIAGQVDGELSSLYAKTLMRDDVQVLGFVKDIASVYAAADVFVFPTHEEGGPQVIYEAAGCGLASIVSPMGAGRIVRHEVECLIIDPLDVNDVAAAIAKVAADGELRRALGAAAAKRAREFTWSEVGARLYETFRGIADARTN